MIPWVVGHRKMKFSDLANGRTDGALGVSPNSLLYTHTVEFRCHVSAATFGLSSVIGRDDCFFRLFRWNRVGRRFCYVLLSSSVLSPGA